LGQAAGETPAGHSVACLKQLFLENIEKGRILVNLEKSKNLNIAGSGNLPLLPFNPNS